MIAPSVCAVLRDLVVGGVPRVYVDILAALRQRGHRVRIVAGGGSLAAEAAASGIELVEIDWEQPYPDTFEAVLEGTAGFDATVLVVDPAVVHAIPAIRATTERTLLAVHSSAVGMRQWFAPDHLRRLALVARAITADGAAGILTIGRRQAAEHAPMLGVGTAAVGVLPPAIEVSRFPYDPAGREPVVLTVARLSAEKRWAIDAGIALVAERLASGRAARLDVVGDGPWREQALELCGAVLPAGSFRFLGESLDVAPHMRRAAVVLATGISALEGLAVGRPVVLGRPLSDDTSLPAAVLEEANFDAAKAAGFSGETFPGCDVAAVWRRVDGLTPEESRALRLRVEQGHSTDVAVEAMLAMLAALRPRRETGLAPALGRVAAELDQRRADAASVADELWLAKQWYEQRLAEAEGRTPARER